MEEEEKQEETTVINNISEYDNVIQNLKSELIFEKRKYDVCISSLNKSLLDYSKLQDYLNETISKNEELVNILDKKDKHLFKKNTTIAELENRISDMEEQHKADKNAYDLLQNEKKEYEVAYNNSRHDNRVLNEQNVELLTRINTVKNSEVSTSSTNTDYHRLIDIEDHEDEVKKCMCVVC
jgi:hypothetical protein